MGILFSSSITIEVIYQRYKPLDDSKQVTLAYFGIEPCVEIIVAGERYYPAITFASGLRKVDRKKRGVGCIEFIEEYNKQSPKELSGIVGHTLLAYKNDNRLLRNEVLRGKMQFIFEEKRKKR